MDTKLKQKNFKLSEEIDKKFRILCIEEGITQQEAFNQMVDFYLNVKGKKRSMSKLGGKNDDTQAQHQYDGEHSQLEMQ